MGRPPLRSVVVVAPSYPWPALDGGRIGMLYRIRALVQAGVQVHLLCTPKRSEGAGPSPLEDWCRTVTVVRRPAALAVVWRRPWLPYQSVSRVRPELLSALGQACATVEPDIVHLEHTYLAPAAAAVPRHLPVAVGVHNLEASALAARALSIPSFPKRIAFMFEGWRMARFERDWFRNTAITAWLFVSEDERREVEWLYPNIQGCAWTVPPGTELPEPRLAGGARDSFVFVGSLWYDPNLEGLRWFVRAVWPRILDAEPRARLVVAGRRPPTALAGELARVPALDFLGEVPRVDAVYGRGRVIVLPVRHGAGVKVKTIEALAQGVPCVGTSHAFEGLSRALSSVARIADDAEKFADACLLAWHQSDENRLRAASALEFVRKHYSWDAVGAQYVTALTEIVASCRRTTNRRAR